MSEQVTLSSGEKLILIMLCDLFEHLKIEDKIDIELVRAAIGGGHLWALEWEMTGIFHGEETSSEVASETAHILTMWETLERSYEKLSKEDKEWLASNCPDLYGSPVRFRGFDGNSETDHIGVMRLFTENMRRFAHFKGRDFNAHLPNTLGMHRRMLPVFEKIFYKESPGDLTAAQIAQVFAAESYHQDAASSA